MRTATATPSPTSMTPAPSPGPTSTHGASVGKRPRYLRDDLYEQCSLHITEYIASSRSDGSRPSRLTMALNSSSVIPSMRCLGSTDGSLTGGAKAGDLPLFICRSRYKMWYISKKKRCFVMFDADTQGEQESGEPE